MADMERPLRTEALLELKSRSLLVHAIEQHDLRPDLPPHFAPTQVIRREMIPIRNELRCEYRGIDGPTSTVGNPNYSTIENFVRNAAAGGYVANPATVAEDNPLSVLVSADSYVVIQLAPELDWQFATAQAALTLGHINGTSNPYALYGDLKYVLTDGTISDAPLPDCQLVYFAARHFPGTRPNPYRQKFNIVVEVDEDTAVLVDPDIRHPGNGST